MTRAYPNAVVWLFLSVTRSNGNVLRSYFKYLGWKFRFVQRIAQHKLIAKNNYSQLLRISHSNSIVEWLREGWNEYILFGRNEKWSIQNMTKWSPDNLVNIWNIRMEHDGAADENPKYERAFHWWTHYTKSLNTFFFLRNSIQGQLTPFCERMLNRFFVVSCCYGFIIILWLFLYNIHI